MQYNASDENDRRMILEAVTDNIRQDNTIVLNSPEDIDFRRNSSTLSILGAGVIIFGFWSIVKIVTYSVLGIPLYTEADVEAAGGVSIDIIVNVLYCMLAGDILVRLVVGLCARAEGQDHNKRKSGLYLGFTIWEIIFEVFSVISVIVQFLSLNDDTFIEVYVSLFMELSSLLILIEVYIAALSVRRYKKRMALKLKDR